jgi:hypothetical protein
MARTGWTRISRGSHAGHIPVRTQLRGLARSVGPRDARLLGRGAAGRRRAAARRRHVPLLPGRDLDERTSTSEGLHLIALEAREIRRRYRRHAEPIAPPWRKEAYRDPEDGGP